MGQITLEKCCASLHCTCSIRVQTASSLGCFNLGSYTELGMDLMIKWPLPILSFDSEAGYLGVMRNAPVWK